MGRKKKFFGDPVPEESEPVESVQDVINEAAPEAIQAAVEAKSLAPKKDAIADLQLHPKFAKFKTGVK
jgi:hypothetical protein